jgi:phosphoribosylformimino-5-aminoimidazole carboxamide ribotide isomerase
VIVYPAIDLRAGKCVRLRQGDYAQETVFADDPVTVARGWQYLGAEYLHLVDLDGAKEGKPVNGAVIQAIARAV